MLNKGFASVIFILLTFLFIILQSFFILILKTQNLSAITMQRIKRSTEIFQAHYAKLKDSTHKTQHQDKIITAWGDRQIITPLIFEGQKWLAKYEDTYLQ
jgi:hypothetical protein